MKKRRTRFRRKPASSGPRARYDPPLGILARAGGRSLDQSYQLEPSQVAGFGTDPSGALFQNPSRGPTRGPSLRTFGVSLEQKFDTGTYLGVSGELLNSDVRRTVGAFDVFPDNETLDYAVPSSLRQSLDYQEQSLLFTVNQLVGQSWSFGARYRIGQAVLKESFVDVPESTPGATFRARQRLESVLQEWT